MNHSVISYAGKTWHEPGMCVGVNIKDLWLASSPQVTRMGTKQMGRIRVRPQGSSISNRLMVLAFSLSTKSDRV